MLVIRTLSIAVLGLLVWSCQPASSDEKAAASSPFLDAQLAEGLTLLENNCFSCHNPDPAITARVAPTWAAIKRAYIEEDASFTTFNTRLSAFLKQPDGNIRLPEAVKEYGPMPIVGYTNAQIAAIAAYLYQSKIEAPGWFAQEYTKDKAKYGSRQSAEAPIERGQSLAMKTKGVLGKNLLGAIKREGTKGALAFCNERAYPLTDSMSTALDARIKRVSDRNRNPANSANEQELAYIDAAKATLANGGEIQPQMIEVDGHLVGYYPILTNDMCLQCHGKVGEQVLPETQAAILTHYPEDKATGYAANELRGIWVVEMDK